LARIKEDRAKKLAQAKHMLELGCLNEEATFDIEQRAANSTLEVCRPTPHKFGILALGTWTNINLPAPIRITQFRKAELRYRMMGRVDDTLEDLEEGGKQTREDWLPNGGSSSFREMQRS
jgi:hypothetical protein